MRWSPRRVLRSGWSSQPDRLAPMEESTFTLIVLICAAVVLAAVFSNRLTRLLRVPTPAVFLVLAAVAALFLPRFGDELHLIDQRVVSIALVFILFDGGMHIGWGKFRRSLGPIAWIGIAGTAVTAAAIAQASTNGTPARTADAATSPPTMRNSPWAKLTMPVKPNTRVMPTASKA